MFSSEKQSVQKAALYLLSLADTLDAWAQQSETGGWSTHQVKANRDKAQECRAQAAILLRMTVES